MGFHHNWTILTQNLHSKEVKNKAFSLDFLTSFNVNYSCCGEKQIISLCDTDCEVFTVLGLALNSLLVSPVGVLRALRTYLSLPCFPVSPLPPCPQPRTPCQPPRAISACLTGAEAGLVSFSPQPCPAQPSHGDTWQKTSTAARLSWCCMAWLMLWWDMVFNHPGFLAGSALPAVAGTLRSQGWQQALAG